MSRRTGRPAERGSTVYEVNSCQEATELAQEFRHRGRYNWFRGHVSHAYFVVPNLLRPTTNQEDAERRLDHFFSWVGQTRGLESIAEDETATYAVAQHYHIPTHLVDFTLDPDVAGFFASDTDKPMPAKSMSAIVCLNTEDLMKVALPAEWPKPRCVSIHVSDLWRIQAQQGVFLVCPYTHFEQVVYPFDRIVFPYGPPASIDRTKIYPARKSQLEIALDHFLAEEWLGRARSLLEKRFKRRPVVVSAQSDKPSYWSSAVEGEINQLASWEPDRINAWAPLPDERFGSSNGSISVEVGELSLHRAELTSAARRKIFDTVLRQLDIAPLRTEPVRWRLTSSILSSEGDPVVAPELTSALEALWDGLRRLPLHNEQIASAAENCVAFWAIADRNPTGSLSLSAGQATRVLGQHRYVEIGGAGGYSKSYASTKRLLAALRPDMAKFLVEEFRAQFIRDPSIIVEWAWKADYLYDFVALADLVATEMAPYQVLFHVDPVFFSPARIERIGF